jgi:hypothetical protein
MGMIERLAGGLRVFTRIPIILCKGKRGKVQKKGILCGRASRNKPGCSASLKKRNTPGFVGYSLTPPIATPEMINRDMKI